MIFTDIEYGRKFLSQISRFLCLYVQCACLLVPFYFVESPHSFRFVYSVCINVRAHLRKTFIKKNKKKIHKVICWQSGFCSMFSFFSSVHIKFYFDISQLCVCVSVWSFLSVVLLLFFQIFVVCSTRMPFPLKYFY